MARTIVSLDNCQKAKEQQGKKLQSQIEMSKALHTRSCFQMTNRLNRKNPASMLIVPTMYYAAAEFIII